MAKQPVPDEPMTAADLQALDELLKRVDQQIAASDELLEATTGDWPK